jgi:hypothetical protein
MLLSPIVWLVNSSHLSGPLWFGPANVTFEVQFSGDPYDPAENDIHIKFVSGDGRVEDRIAYFDGTSWNATLLAHKPGTFTPILVRNGKDQPDIASTPSTVSVQNVFQPGFIHVDPEHSNRFLREDGSVYLPVGYNLAWQAPQTITLADQIKQMGAIGLTWTRIWAANWDKRNPWWPTDDPGAPHDKMWEPALINWGNLIKACDDANLPFQIAMFNHGSFSSTTDPNWPQHPWNVANGGFLKTAEEFFTDPEAKRRTKLWLRYAVARFDADPNLVAYELFNEVEWTDAAKAGRWADIAAWHSEMASYIRSIDPYNHMVTTSSTLAHPEIWTALDFYQPHLYSADLPRAMAAKVVPKDKPSFYGEFGGPKAVLDRKPLRDALYKSLFLSTGGAGMYWSWDQVESAGLAPEFASLALAVKAANLGKDAVPVSFTVLSEAGTDLGEGIGRSDWALARVVIGKPGEITLKGFSASDGNYALTMINPDTGTEEKQTVKVTAGKLKIVLDSTDVVLVLRRAD